MKHGFPSCHRKTLPVLDPSGDYYYWWLNTMVFPVMYNIIIIVCRFGGTLKGRGGKGGERGSFSTDKG